MDLIFMLTRNDRTVEDCLEVLENIAPLKIGHLGFKDVGVDLLAFRALEAEPLELVRAARLATEKTLIVAGSVDSPGRIRELRNCGVNAFTMGSAVFDGTFSPQKGLLYSQLRDVLVAVR